MQKLVDIIIPAFLFAGYSSFQVCSVMKASKHKLFKLPVLNIWFATTKKELIITLLLVF